MSDTMIVGWDTETERIAPGMVYPPVVCFQTCHEQEAEVTCICETDKFNSVQSAVFDEDIDAEFVAHNLSFDLHVMGSHDPSLYPVIYKMLEAGKFTCTKIREKLLNLTSHGQLEYLDVGEAKQKQLKYSLADLVFQYFGVDLRELKAKTKRDEEGNQVIEGEEDSWRLNYAALKDMPVSEWPQEAIDYAADDAVWAEAIYHEQEKVRQEIIKNLGHDPFETLRFRCCVDFALGFMQQRGVKTDPARIEQTREEIAADLTPEKLSLLVEKNIITPAQPPKPHALGHKDHVDGCSRKNCDCPVKMTQGKKQKLNTAVLHAYVEKLAEDRDDIKVVRNPPSDKFPEGSLCVDKEWRETYAHLDPVLEQYDERQAIIGLLNRDLPKMYWEGEVASVVHPNFDVLKATGRTSSFGGDLYPSFNCQQVDPRVRRGFIPRAGMAMFSIDYSAMELGTFAQTCINLLGYSRLAEIINSGRDPHAYLGAQIALALDEDYRQLASNEINLDDRDGAYELFSSLKENEDTKAIYKYYRNFAKPTGLGYPGGLGPDTFIKFAKGTYRVTVDRPTAVLLRDVWKATLPEAQEYFNYVNNHCIDEYNGPKTRMVERKNKETGEVELVEETSDRYRYMTPMGLHRMACDYCACCNGMALQSPSAEGALLGLYETTKRCTLPSGEFHQKVFPLMFIHDEIVGEIVLDTPSAMTHLLSRFSQYMVQSMEVVTPDVKAKAEPVLMSRWDKFVDPAYDDEGNLVIVDPDQNK